MYTVDLYLRTTDGPEAIQPLEPVARAGAFPSCNPCPLGYRKPTALGARCHHERGSGAQPDENGPEILAILRRIALNLAGAKNSKGSMRGTLERAGWQDEFMLDLIQAAIPA